MLLCRELHVTKQVRKPSNCLKLDASRHCLILTASYESYGYWEAFLWHHAFVFASPQILLTVGRAVHWNTHLAARCGEFCWNQGFMIIPSSKSSTHERSRLIMTCVAKCCCLGVFFVISDQWGGCFVRWHVWRDSAKDATLDNSQSTPINHSSISI